MIQENLAIIDQLASPRSSASCSNIARYFLADRNPPLDLAQGGFRVARGTLDQAFYLAEICTILRRHHRSTLVFSFLDTRSAYNTVDRRYIWKNLENKSPAPPICLQ
ncbi:hypothetical protein G6F46_006345 [Rhizopus delemar]|uniref:Reverse transcriptase domain-containing protein n=2 Tax=Rhizopus TaxID=4842 RepID=A0A9P7CPI0_9FUNG|nr:hypothetical protein G6F36_012409 [Rhizopus arrhizus]KAG1458899.1 hypothetical protein G6F55_005079 [Rhizopus delemar]KAG1526387.1 hypothetical protein G6F52_002476 [Rhizopus delemar]KAG1543761.1 hypothetical protein G6F51_006480 [Rhizopus arrhizus]KAG1560810.1 hypothetical protein G6F49_002364 [Rhizopus delemar]